MYSSAISVFTVALASAAVALPSHDDSFLEARGLKTSFSLPAEYNPPKRVKKRTPVDMPPHPLPPMPITKYGEVEFQPAYMTVTMGVGTPPQNQTVTFDTLAGNTWVFAGDEKPELFHPAKSSSFHNNTAGFSSNPGSNTGYYADDTFHIGTVELKGAWFGVANAGPNTGQGGSMGMAPPAPDKSAYGKPPKGILQPWTATLAETLIKPIVGINIYAGNPGTVDFGYIDKTKYTGTLNYVDADTTGAAWKIDQSYFSIDGVKTTSSSGLPVMLDTGGQTISLDKAITTEYYAKVPGAKDTSGGNQTDYRVPCDATMPDLNIGFNEFQWSSIANIFGNELINYSTADDECTCETLLAARGGNVFGPMFWMSNFVVLDFTRGKSKVGVAAKKTTLPVPKPTPLCQAPPQPSLNQQTSSEPMPTLTPIPSPSPPGAPNSTAAGVFWSGGVCGTAGASGYGTAGASGHGTLQATGCGTAARSTGTAGTTGLALMRSAYMDSHKLPEMPASTGLA